MKEGIVSAGLGQAGVSAGCLDKAEPLLAVIVTCKPTV